MATSDRFNIELTAGNKDRIAVEPWHGRVSILVVDGSGSVEGEAHVVMEAPECDALIAAIGRALGRAAPTSTPLEERIANAATDALAGVDDDKEAWLYATGVEQGLRAALAMVREQGATVPRAGVEAVRERFAKWVREEGGARNEYVEGMTVGIKDAILALDTLLAGAPTPKEPGHADD